MNKINISKVVQDNYINYARQVNSTRSIPSINDGLKIVQRRVLATFKSESINEFVKSSALVGSCLKKFHPHGSSSVYGTLVNIITSSNPLIVGKGNFGFNGVGLVEGGSPAAERYTSAALSDLGRLFIKLYDYTEFYKNENDYDEPVYISTPIPFALLAGSSGIGVGCRTNIPEFALKDLLDTCKSILQSSTNISQLKPNYGYGEVIIDDANLIKLNTEGKCNFIIKAKSKWIDDNTLLVYDIPRSNLNLSKIYKVFKSYIESKVIKVKPIIGQDIQVQIIRTNKCQLSNNEINKLCDKSISTSNMAYEIRVANNHIVQLVNPIDFIKVCTDNSLKSYKKYLHSRLNKLQEDLLFHTIKPKFLELLRSRVYESEDEFINLAVTNLQLTQEQVIKLLNKSNRFNISKTKDLSELQKLIDEVQLKLLNLNQSYFDDILSEFYKLVK